MRSRRIVVVLAATPLALLGAAAPAVADSAPDEEAEAAFTMTMVPVEDEHAPDPPTQEPRKATLTCYPSGGTHPAPDESCEILTVVDGDFDALPVEPGFCTQEWDPVRVTVTGHWFGEPVGFQETYTNAGCAAAGSDGIFAF